MEVQSLSNVVFSSSYYNIFHETKKGLHEKVQQSSIANSTLFNRVSKGVATDTEKKTGMIYDNVLRNNRLS